MQERVLPVEGAVLFLEAVGFCQQMLPHQGGHYIDLKTTHAEANFGVEI